MLKRRNSSFVREIIQLYVLFILTIVAIYKTPSFIAFVFQALLLIIFWRSKKGYFWFAYIFIIESYPGSLFTINDATHSLSLLHQTPLGLLFFWLVFIMTALIKTIKIKPKYPFFLKENILSMLIYIVVLLFAFGFYKLNFFGGLVPWLLLFILPRLFLDFQDYERFFNLIFSFVFFVLITQILYMQTGNWINIQFGGNVGIVDNSILGRTIDDVNEALRPMEGISISFFSLIGSIFYLIYKKSKLSKNYLYTVLGASLFSIFLTATRGWIIASALLVIVFLFISLKNPFSLISKLILLILLFISLFFIVPSLKKQSDLVFDRLLTLVSFSEGDVTAGGTLSRMDERGPKVMNKFKESPIFGFGWSKENIDFRDGHVGNQSLLLSSGIVGYLLFVSLWLTYIVKLMYREKNLSINNPFKKTGILLVTFLLSIFIIHSSTSQWFSYGFGYVRGFIFLFLLTFANHYYWESINSEERLNK